METRQRSSAKWVIVIACGWTAWAWIEASKDGFSGGVKAFAIVSTAFWALAATMAALRFWRSRSDE